MQAVLRSAWQAQPLAVGLPARPRPNHAFPRAERGLPEMVPYQAEFPVADRTTFGSAVTKALGVAEHVCLLSASHRWWSSIGLARPIDSETMGMKQPSQSYAGKRSVSKKHRSNYTRVYDCDARVWEPAHCVWQERRGGRTASRSPRRERGEVRRRRSRPLGRRWVRAGRGNTTRLPAARLRATSRRFN